MTPAESPDTVRLAKRVADMVPCSRREAELYIQGGHVYVDEVLVEEAGARVAPGQAVRLQEGAQAAEIRPVTILLHKPAGVNGGLGRDGAPALSCLTPEQLVLADHGNQRFLKHHLTGLTLAMPIEHKASGLLVLTQDFRVARKLVDEAARVEQELIVDVSGSIADNGLALLNHGLPFNGKPIAPMKVSWQNETRLRFAVKDVKPGQIEHMCKMVGLKAEAIKRIRIGRVPMAGLPAGQWRYLQEYERF